ncbi:MULTISPECIES: hypothetical protein [Paraburkholderia]|uniref:hypothetical protein n=1 Tax=Paraburkholderia TaxID=1822464 RepID=UPI002254B760|nr:MULTISPECIES: hypothetical protein [Paraburkholderia]MCX4175801.1 hypothetical protein [Paraburkholderia madseniana]MDQ6463795.1 hypothetical protein [Paraburkholderia madseniana]
MSELKSTMGVIAPPGTSKRKKAVCGSLAFADETFTNPATETNSPAIASTLVRLS